MSKLQDSFHLIPAILLIILHSLNIVSAQDSEIRVKIESISPPIIRVEGKQLSQKGKNFFFLKDTGGIEISGERVSNVVLMNNAGQPVQLRKLAPGEYLADGE